MKSLILAHAHCLCWVKQGDPLARLVGVGVAGSLWGVVQLLGEAIGHR